MKRSKWLLTIPTVAIATVTSVVSCGNGNITTIDDIEDAIFGPHDLTEKTPHPGCSTFVECLKQASEKERQKELLYSIFAPLFYLKAADSALAPFNETPLYDLWKDQTLLLSANISQCSLDIEDDIVYADFFGYVKLTFQKDWGDDLNGFKVNDFLQFTFILDDEIVTPETPIWYLKYKELKIPEVMSWGLVQVKKQGINHLLHWDWIGIGIETEWGDFPQNYHNWVKE